MRSRVTRRAPLWLSAQLWLSSPFHLSRSQTSHPRTIMTRTHKVNDREYQAEGGIMPPHDNLPRFFGRSGPTDADPKKTKKDGGGKGNWGRDGEEVHDYGYTFTNARRRSNSSTQGLSDFRTKFETIDPEPVFEEQVHGAEVENVNEDTVTKVESTSSSSASVGDQNGVKF
ncbi:hypothetical protein N7532_006212 [Penicillium argentinense]|uniref:Uncharacterized protein n=1 Tax=Penicillium argentinense TaxID=1131581 RepID=A0A9W9KB52_9EURO|nr:uncharacterized protein N7532_006212 [Penicillium argentinense]KAJ5099211.1 hypothetical protein N7532_006212 [Penicillium argentinense]